MQIKKGHPIWIRSISFVSEKWRDEYENGVHENNDLLGEPENATDISVSS